MSPPISKTIVPIPGAPDDASIPLLTERLMLPPLELDTTLPVDPGDEAQAPAAQAASAPTPAPVLASPPPLAPRPADTTPMGRPTVQPTSAPMFSTALDLPASAPAQARMVAPAVTPPLTQASAIPTRAPSFTFAPGEPAPMESGPAPPASGAVPPAAFAVLASAAPAGAATAQPAPAPSPAQTAAVASGRTPADAAGGANWTRIELELRTSILNELAQALPLEVDAIVRNKMGDAIDRMIQQLAAETRLAIAGSLRDIVEHAVRSELDRLRGRKR